MQEGAEGGTMLVYPQRRPSAMRFHCSQSKQLQRHFHFCLILSLQQSDWKTQPHRLWLSLVLFLNASSFRQFSMRREAKEKEGFSFHGHWIHSARAQVCLSDTRPFCKRPQHSEDSEGGPFRLQRVRGAAGGTGFSQNEFSSSDYIACISFFEC